jgi:hypothetical protein
MSQSKGEVAQVGGNHYASVYQHWDWAADTKMGYLEGNATKYLSRWRKKNGLEDLKKARSYVDKIITYAQQGYKNQSTYVYSAFAQFCDCNKIQGPERDAMLLLSLWSSQTDLVRVRSIITDLICLHFPEEMQSKITTPNPFNQTQDPNEGDEDVTIIEP